MILLQNGKTLELQINNKLSLIKKKQTIYINGRKIFTVPTKIKSLIFKSEELKWALIVFAEEDNIYFIDIYKNKVIIKFENKIIKEVIL